MRAPRYAAVVPVPDRNPFRNPLPRSYPSSQSSDSDGDTSDSGRDAGGGDGDSESAASSASDPGDAPLEEEDADDPDESESDGELSRPLHRAYSSSSRSSSVSSASSSLFSSSSSSSSSSSDDDDDDALDSGADFFFDKALKRHIHSGADLQNEPSMFPAAMRSDNVGGVAWLIPLVGVSTMVGTDTLACFYHFECPEKFPTLSYAATFKPEGHVFTAGMCVTAILIAATVALFHWFLRLHWHAANLAGSTQQKLVGGAALVFGEVCAASLFGLAVFDMRNHHDAHITFTILFFATSWAMMLAVHQSRRLILRSNGAVKGGEPIGPLSSSSCASIGDTPASLVTSLRRWKRLKFATAYSLGKLMLLTGLASTAMFALLFVCVNGVWPNPVGFSAAQEAFFEAFAIVCQLFFMGTVSCELSMLTRLVEHQDYTQLERAE